MFIKLTKEQRHKASRILLIAICISLFCIILVHLSGLVVTTIAIAGLIGIFLCLALGFLFLFKKTIKYWGKIIKIRFPGGDTRIIKVTEYIIDFRNSKNQIEGILLESSISTDIVGTKILVYESEVEVFNEGFDLAKYDDIDLIKEYIGIQDLMDARNKEEKIKELDIEKYKLVKKEMKKRGLKLNTF